MRDDERSVEERYYRGTILRLHSGSETGWLRTDSGRELRFNARDAQLLGTRLGFSGLQPGLRVGFDLGRDSHGLCVTTIRVYDTP